MAVRAVQRLRSDRPFERLYRRHVDDVYRYALAVLANPADAEDVTQTAFLNAYRAFKNGHHPERPLNWLFAIAHNVCRQRFRDAARRPSEVVLDRELAAESDHDEDGSFRREDIRRALSQLTFSQRSALAMRELEGRSYKEIAKVLGITEAAVEALIFRARRAFREQLEGTLTCSEAERAISRQLDGMLARGERAALRAHLRACAECASLARRFRAQRAALRGIVLVPLPQSLSSFSAAGTGLAGGAALGTGLGIKAVAFGAAALLAAGVSTEIVRHPPAGPARIMPRAVPASGRLASSRRVVEQLPASRTAAPTTAKVISVLGRRSVHRAAPRGTTARLRANGRHLPTTTLWPTGTSAPAKLPHSSAPGSAGRRPPRPATPSRGGGNSFEGAAAGSNRPDQTRKPSRAGKPFGSGKPSGVGRPAATPALKAQPSAKKDQSGSSNGATVSGPQTRGPQLSQPGGATSPPH